MSTEKINKGIVAGVVYTSSDDFAVENLPSDLNDICRTVDEKVYFNFVCNKDYDKEGILVTTKELSENEANAEFADLLASTYGE